MTIAVSADGSRAAVAMSSRAVARARVYDPVTGELVAESDEFFSDFFTQSPVSADGSAAAGVLADGSGARVVQVADGATMLELEECDTPVAFDDAGRWLLVNGSALSEGCHDAGGDRVVDVATGQTVMEFPGATFYRAFGPLGTPADGVVVTQNLEDLEQMEIRRLPEKRVLATLPIVGSTATFSADGRYLGVGSQELGGWVIEVAELLEDTSIEDAVVFNPLVEGGPTNRVLVTGDRVVTTHSGEVVRIWDLPSQNLWLRCLSTRGTSRRSPSRPTGATCTTPTAAA